MQLVKYARRHLGVLTVKLFDERDQYLSIFHGQSLIFVLPWFPIARTSSLHLPQRLSGAIHYLPQKFSLRELVCSKRTHIAWGRVVIKDTTYLMNITDHLLSALEFALTQNIQLARVSIAR